jgi:phosphorylcholine metabolism protein LicD
MRKINIILVLILIIFLCFYYFNKSKEYYNKENINNCYSKVMSKEEEDILYQLINIWNKVSNDLDIKWSICAGSYIGFKRNGGRIPWDDDFDLTIMKKDLYKMTNIDKMLSKYNVSISKFWGGYKIFFNDHRGITKFSNYGWNWPFIDIFAMEKYRSKECNFLDKSEFPLNKVKFGNSSVFVYQNPMKHRASVNKTTWKTELLDTGYRHQLERYIKTKCSPKYK